MRIIPRSAVAVIQQPIERANVLAIAALVIAGVALFVALGVSHNAR